jgi:hypothetical protein
VKWWFPARFFGIEHKSSFFEGMTPREIHQWKRDREDAGVQRMAQPPYDGIVRLGARRWGLTVHQPDGTRAVHELGRWSLDAGR